MANSFNPRRPRGRRRNGDHLRTSAQHVSIHAARAGGDNRVRQAGRRGCGFNPRRPRGRRRSQPRPHLHARHSFNPRRPRGRRRDHTALATRSATSFNPRRPRGRRLASDVLCDEVGGFNPRRPRGRRRDRCRSSVTTDLFQSTPPARAATWPDITGLEANAFQSTPPARAATPARSARFLHAFRFNPRRPRGRRRQTWTSNTTACLVSIHAARAGGDSLARCMSKLTV